MSVILFKKPNQSPIEKFIDHIYADLKPIVPAADLAEPSHEVIFGQGDRGQQCWLEVKQPTQSLVLLCEEYTQWEFRHMRYLCYAPEYRVHEDDGRPYQSRWVQPIGMPLLIEVERSEEGMFSTLNRNHQLFNIELAKAFLSGQMRLPEWNDAHYEWKPPQFRP